MWTKIPCWQTSMRFNIFFDVGIFQSVIELQKGNKTESVVDDYIYAINHYLDNDDFYESS